MDEAIESAYIALIRERSEMSEPYKLLIGEILEQQKLIGFRVRPDAAYFIANNLFDLVLEPLLRAVEDGNVGGERTVSTGDLFVMMVADVKTILLQAKSVAASREREYISGTSALIATSTLVDELQVSRAKIWGRLDS